MKRFLCMLYKKFTSVDLSFQKPMETSMTLLNFFWFLPEVLWDNERTEDIN